MNRRTLLGSALIGGAATAAGAAAAAPNTEQAAAPRASGRTGPLNLITDVEGIKIGQDDGDAGADARVVGLSDLDALDIGDQIQRPGATRSSGGRLRCGLGARSAGD